MEEMITVGFSVRVCEFEGQRWPNVWEAEVIGECVKAAPQARAAGIVTLDARVVATILTLSGRWPGQRTATDL